MAALAVNSILARQVIADGGLFLMWGRGGG